jgi:hypothetical protein
VKQASKTTRQSRRETRELYRIFPVLARFYGLSIRELIKCPRWLLDMYVEEMPRLIAAEQMRMNQAAAYGMATRQGRSRVDRQLQRQARRPAGIGESSWQQAKSRAQEATQTWEQGVAGLGIPIKRVKAKGAGQPVNA